MNQLAVKLGYLTFGRYVHKNEKGSKDSGLGCKGSSVQIRPRRPNKPLEIIKQSNENRALRGHPNSAQNGSNRHTKEGVAGGKIGVRPSSSSAPSERVIFALLFGRDSILARLSCRRSPNFIHSTSSPLKRSGGRSYGATQY